MREVLVGVVCLLMVVGFAAAEAPRSQPDLERPPDGWVKVGPLRLPDTVDHAAAKRALSDRHAWLMVEQVEAGVERPLSIQVTTKELAEIELGVCEGCSHEPEALRVGITKPVSARVSLHSPEWGAVDRTYDAGRVWSAAVRSEGAFGLRLHFKRFQLPADTELYLYNERGEVAGPYSGVGPLGSGEFWSNMVSGDTVYLQLRQYGPAEPEKVRASAFDLVGVGHVGSAFARSAGVATKAFCSFNADCIVNAGCVTGLSESVDDLRYAVAKMMWVKRPYIYICTGGLLNTTGNTETPYFLTANHCISRDREAASLEAFFQFDVDCSESYDCPKPSADPGASVPSTLGASVVATNRTGDFTLLLLNENAPSGSAFMGWNAEPVANTHGAVLHRISHPSGAPQAYSKHSVDKESFTCSSWPRGSWIYSQDLQGATEGGSSGSPVVDAQGLVVGQLSGGCGYNLSDDCDSENNRTVDGAFASYYNQVAQWLDPPGCSTDADGDDYVSQECGGNDCDDGNVSINPGATESCDGVDNNCDGTIDEGCGCLPVGVTCTANDQCCSGMCHPKKLVCK